MGSVAAAVRIVGVSGIAGLAVLLTALEITVAVVLAAAIVLPVWSNGLIGLAYIAAVATVLFRVATKQASFSKGVFELLAVDAVALPFALAAMAM